MLYQLTFALEFGQFAYERELSFDRRMPMLNGHYKISLIGNRAKVPIEAFLRSTAAIDSLKDKFNNYSKLLVFEKKIRWII